MTIQFCPDVLSNPKPVFPLKKSFNRPCANMCSKFKDSIECERIRLP